MEQSVDITNFTAGELSPRLKGRIDMEKYFNGADTLENFVIFPQGGMTRRPGTLYVYNAKDQANPCKLIPFVFSTLQAYLLEFSALNIRVFKDDGVVLNAGVPVDINTPPYAAADLPALKYAQSADTLYLVHGSYKSATLTRSSHVDWTYSPIAFKDGPYLDLNTTDTTLSPSGTSGTITITASSTTGINKDQGFVATDVGRLIRIKLYSLWAWVSITVVTSATVVQAEVQAKVHNGAAGAIDGAAWAANTYYDTGTVVTNGGKYFQATTGGISGPGTGPAGTGSNILDGTAIWQQVGALNASAWAHGTNYEVGDIVTNAGNYYICTVAGASAGSGGPTGTGTGIVDGTVTWNYDPPFVFPTTTKDWRLGAWGETNGYPMTVRFWQGRLIFGGYTAQPNEIFGSSTADFTNMAPSKSDGTVIASNALDWTIDDDEVNAIYSLIGAGSAQAMQLGILTSGGEHILQGATTSQALTPDNVQAYDETAYGSAPNVNALRIGKAVLFADKTGRKIREWAFYWQSNGYIGPDLTQLSEHITRAPEGLPASMNGLSQMVYQQAPHQVVWALRNDGTLISMTYDRDQTVFAPARHRLGGQYYGGAPLVESIAVIPATDGTYDELWLSVLRTVNGTPVRFIEVMTRYFDGAAADDAFFVDAGLSSTLTAPAATATVSGLANTAEDTMPPSYSGDAGTLATSADAFTGASVNSIVRINGGKAVVTAYNNARNVTIKVLVPLKSLTPAASGSWSCTALQTVFAGLDHLTGETVKVVGDGAARETQQVVAGAITLSAPGASYATAGLHCSPVYVSMPWEPARAAAAASQGKLKRVDTMWVRFYESLGCEFGRRITDPMTAALSDKTEPLKTRSGSGFMNNAPTLFTGVRKLHPQGGTDQEGQILITQNEPLPLTVNAIFGRGDVAEMPRP